MFIEIELSGLLEVILVFWWIFVDGVEVILLLVVVLIEMFEVLKLKIWYMELVGNCICVDFDGLFLLLCLDFCVSCLVLVDGGM